MMVLVDEEENDEYEEMMMLTARLAAMELMQMEEGELQGVDGDWWVPVTVNINEYQMLGNPCFQHHFRMTCTVFMALCHTIETHLVLKGRLRRKRTPITQIMLMVVWLLATPDSFRSVVLRFGVNPGTLYYFYYYIMEAFRELASQYIAWPSAEERQAISHRFQRATGFPGIIGSIDCTHVNVTAPLKHPAQYINRHHSHSYNTQPVVDDKLLIRSLHVGEAGSMHDNRVFRRSQLHHDILHAPPGEIIGPDENLVGDGAYSQSTFMMVPFPNNCHLTPPMLNLNKKLSQARVRVENGFALAKGKWRRLKFLHARNPTAVVGHITASFVLHNFIILNGDTLFDEDELARQINENEILGNKQFEVEEDDGDENHILIAAANADGLEKRIHYMDNVLPQ